MPGPTSTITTSPLSTSTAATTSPETSGLMSTSAIATITTSTTVPTSTSPTAPVSTSTTATTSTSTTAPTSTSTTAPISTETTGPTSTSTTAPTSSSTTTPTSTSTTATTNSEMSGQTSTIATSHLSTSSTASTSTKTTAPVTSSTTSPMSTSTTAPTSTSTTAPVSTTNTTTMSTSATAPTSTSPTATTSTQTSGPTSSIPTSPFSTSTTATTVTSTTAPISTETTGPTSSTSTTAPVSTAIAMSTSTTVPTSAAIAISTSTTAPTSTSTTATTSTEASELMSTITPSPLSTSTAATTSTSATAPTITGTTTSMISSTTRQTATTTNNQPSSTTTLLTTSTTMLSKTTTTLPTTTLPTTTSQPSTTQPNTRTTVLSTMSTTSAQPTNATVTLPTSTTHSTTTATMHPTTTITTTTTTIKTTTTTTTRATTTTTTTRTTTSPTTTTTPGQCENGGTWVNGQCVCPPGYTGANCISIESSIETKAGREPSAPTSSPQRGEIFWGEPGGGLRYGERESEVTMGMDFKQGMAPHHPKVLAHPKVQGEAEGTGPQLRSKQQTEGPALKCLPCSNKQRLVVPEANVSVSVELRVTNQEYTEDLRNESSEVYKSFVLSFTLQMEIVYRNIEGYQGIRILSLSPGSIVVNHTVIVAVPVTADTVEKISNVTKNVQEEIVQAATQQENCTDNKPSTMGLASGLGTTLIPTSPPHSCRETNLYWYQGDRCKSRVSKMAVGMGLAVAVLCLVIFVLAAFLFRAKWQKWSDRSSDLTETKQHWYEEEDENWEVPGGFTIQNEGAHDTMRVDLQSVDTSAQGEITPTSSIPTTTTITGSSALTTTSSTAPDVSSTPTASSAATTSLVTTTTTTTSITTSPTDVTTTINSPMTTSGATTSPTTTTMMTTGQCENGGTWVNGQCVCRPGYTGANCGSVDSSIETKAAPKGAGSEFSNLGVTLGQPMLWARCLPMSTKSNSTKGVEANVSVSVELRVTNQEYTEDLRNESSEVYKSFVLSFTLQMEIVYRNIEGYQGIRILSLSPGSIVVNHTVIVAVPVTADTVEKISNVTKNVQEEIVQAATQQENCTDNSTLCFNASEVTITQPSYEFNATAYCRQIAPNDFQNFYYPNITKSGLTCVSNCSANTASAIDCNEGQCQLTRHGPQCFCRETNLYWYQDNRCKSRVSKMAVGMGLAVAVLCLVIFGLAAFIFRSRRQKSLDRYSNLTETKKQWYEEEDENWKLPGGFTIQNDDVYEDTMRVDLQSVDTLAKAWLRTRMLLVALGCWGAPKMGACTRVFLLLFLFLLCGVAAGVCENGGTWVNGQCVCPPGYTGTTCGSVESSIETKAETNVSVSVKLRVTNQEFTDDLRNESSEVYKSFVLRFTLQMEIVYRNIEGYQGIRILSLSPGSIVVNHTVIVAVPVTADTVEKISNVTKNVQEEIVQAATQQENCTDNSTFCFNASEVTITQPSYEFNATEYCRQIAPSDFENFYYPNITKSGLTCVSNCSANTASAMDCNEGQCQLTPTGPQCFCRETNIYWYLDNRCKSRVSKITVGLGVAVAVLCLVILVLAILLCIAKRPKSSESASDLKEHKENWYEDMNEDWTPPRLLRQPK
ncbi:Mucin-3B [Anas platyrhynchos]|uniref:Mucin-3B n=1 Tax=Anas platyrhynchos TaxID=8839 RepID=R0KKB9_ANAPL|nr:Mucin-3B [Anas platyrhynchos]